MKNFEKVIDSENKIEYMHCSKKMYDVYKIYDFLMLTKGYFHPSLDVIINLHNWAIKLYNFADLIVAKKDNIVVGMVAFYFNESPVFSYGTYIAVLNDFSGDCLIGPKLIMQMIDYCKNNNSGGLRFELRLSNKALVKFYTKLGFVIEKEWFCEKEKEQKAYMLKLFEKKEKYHDN